MISTSFREALLACPPSPPWNLPSFTVESALSSPCSCCDPPLTRQGTALAHFDSLPPHELVIWTDASVRFPFGKGSSDALAKSCTIVHALCWSWQHQQVCHFSFLFLLFNSRSVLTPCPLLHLSFYLNLCGRSGRTNLHFSCSIRLQWVPRHSFLLSKCNFSPISHEFIILLSLFILIVFHLRQL